MRSRSIVALTLAAAAALGTQALGTRALAQQKMALKASEVHPAGYPTVVPVEHLGDKLATATNGRLRSTG